MATHVGYQPRAAFAWGDDCGQHCGLAPRRGQDPRHCPTCHSIAVARRLDEQHNAAPPPVDARNPEVLATEVAAIEQRDARLVRRDG